MISNKVIVVLGQRIKKVRIALEMTQGEVADRAGVARMVVSKIETGKNISLESLISIFQAIGEVHRFNDLLPEPEVSPVKLSMTKGKVPQRVKKKKKDDSSKGGWTWSE